MDNSYIITVYPDYINFQDKKTGVNYRLYKDCSFGIQKNIPEELLEVAGFIRGIELTNEQLVEELEKRGLLENGKILKV